MGLFEALLSPSVLAAIGVHLAVLAALIALTLWIEPRVREVGPTHWLLEHMGYPLGRAVVVVSFVLVAYPTLFGLTNAPALGDVIQVGSGRLQSLVNWVFVVSLFLPLLPVLGGIQALILPLQGMVATALLFHWVAGESGMQGVHYWPGWGQAAVIVALAFASHGLAQSLSRTLGSWANESFHLADAEDLVFEAVVLLCQIPVLLVYGLALGHSLQA